MKGVNLEIQDAYKAGDLPPEGYLAWHEWADAQRKAGIKQVRCPLCDLFRTPQELSDTVIDCDKGNNRICTKCDDKSDL